MRGCTLMVHWPLGGGLARACKLVRGIEQANSIASDAHKWLNVPYDCGIIFCSDEAAHRGAMSLAAAYIVATGGERDPHEFVPEESRRARAVPVYAALRALDAMALPNSLSATAGRRADLPPCCGQPGTMCSTR